MFKSLFNRAPHRLLKCKVAFLRRACRIGIAGIAVAEWRPAIDMPGAGVLDAPTARARCRVDASALAWRGYRVSEGICKNVLLRSRARLIPHDLISSRTFREIPWMSAGLPGGPEDETARRNCNNG
jgi:hypothetical protein